MDDLLLEEANTALPLPFLGILALPEAMIEEDGVGGRFRVMETADCPTATFVVWGCSATFCRVCTVAFDAIAMLKYKGSEKIDVIK